MRNSLFGFMFCLFAACTSSRPKTTVDPHLGTTTFGSGTHRAGSGRDHQVHVRAIVVETSAARISTLLTYVTRFDLDFPKIETVRAFGRVLAYERIDRQRAGPLRAEAGRLDLGCDLFARLAKTGLAFRMYGPRGTYDAAVPARVFAEPLARRP